LSILHFKYKTFFRKIQSIAKNIFLSLLRSYRGIPFLFSASFTAATCLPCGADARKKETGGSLLIGEDLGPNLSVTGSLATILWLIVLRREGIIVSAREFFKLGAIVMFPALLASLLVLFLCT